MTHKSAEAENSQKRLAVGVAVRCNLRGGALATHTLSPADFSTLRICPVFPLQAFL
jgi:hypothetical protein